MENGQILQDITFLIENYQNDYYNMEDMKGLLYDAVNEILEMAVSHGFEGDLWHNYLTYLWQAMRMLTVHPAKLSGR